MVKLYLYNIDIHKCPLMANTFNSLQRFFSARPAHGHHAFHPIKEYDGNETSFKGSILLKQYNSPCNHDMLVIVPFFNPCNSIRIIQNLLLVKSKLDASGIPYVIPHCLFPDSVPLMQPSNNYFTVKSNSYAFVKENLANIAIERSNDTYSKFVVLDGDIMFDNENWYNDLCAELDNVDIVQPFSTYHSLDHNFHNIIASGVGLFANYIKVRRDKELCDESYATEIVKGHPGYAIAFTHSYLNRQKYPDLNLIGGGDTMMCSLALKIRLFAGQVNNKYFHWIYDKYVTYPKDAPVAVGALDCAVYHLYHNNYKNRQYTSRDCIYNRYIRGGTTCASIGDMVYKNEDGIYEWIDSIKHNINRDILNYFSSRQDDEVIINS